MRRFRACVTRLAAAAFLMAAPACAAPQAAPGEGARTVSTISAGGRTLFGEAMLSPAGGPLVLLFHQGGSSGRGEYAELLPALSAAGYRAIAWDLSSGGETYGSVNRTVAALEPGQAPEGFCDVYPDLAATLDHAERLAERVIVWGSSYSGSLVFRLAAEHPDRVAGVAAFSPASGGPMAECRAGLWAADVSAPVLVMRPASEMETPSARAQRDALAAAGADFHVIENGVHGASLLVDARTGADMSGARAIVLDWLAAVSGEG